MALFLLSHFLSPSAPLAQPQHSAISSQRLLRGVLLLLSRSAVTRPLAMRAQRGAATRGNPRMGEPQGRREKPPRSRAAALSACLACSVCSVGEGFACSAPAHVATDQLPRQTSRRRSDSDIGRELEATHRSGPNDRAASARRGSGRPARRTRVRGGPEGLPTCQALRALRAPRASLRVQSVCLRGEFRLNKDTP